ncbi:DNA polymerase III subunit gamma and tau [Enemella sp. A6]|uniref:DNA polymerase III subunit gamma and tau n=1 Tax=Enemella sp. A6 TaxID=3440152 RepID=UPI003EBF7909
MSEPFDEDPTVAMAGEAALIDAPPPADRPEALLALYRRYRPETFAEVIGQDHVTEPLQRALTNNRVNHAYLFSGPRGCGKTTSARILARALNCEQGPTPVPCGECDSCRALARGGAGSIDVIEIDAASHGGVDDARDLRERAFFAPVHSRYKIYIVDEAHMVTTAGFNAMLKVVEEPPPHVKFIFATTEPDKVIGTIRSRTHHYPFRLVPPKALGNYLAEVCASEGVDIERTVLPLVVRAGGGSVRDSLSVLDQLLGGAADEGVTYAQASALLGFTPDSLLDEIVDAFAAGDGAGVFATVDKVIEVGQDPRRFAEDLLRRFRDLVITTQVPDAISSGLVDVAADQAERLVSQGAALGAGELTRAAEVLAKGITDMRGTTAPRLHLELMCSRILLPEADLGGRGLHARIDRLERRIGVDGPVAADEQEAARPIARPAPQRPSPPSQAERSEGVSQPAEAAQSAGTPQSGGAGEGRPATPVEQPVAEAGSGRAESGGTDSGRTELDRADADRAAEPAPNRSRPATDSPSAPADTPGDDRGSQEAARSSTESQPTERQPEPRPADPAPPAEAASVAGAPVEGAPVETVPAASAPAESAPAAGGGLSTADMRRLWPDVLEEVKRRRRFTWILLSQNAQVVEVVDGQLTLALANAGARDRFGSGGSQDVLADALVEVVGANLRIVTIVDGAAVAPRGRGGQRSPDPAPRQRAPQERSQAAPQESRPADSGPQGRGADRPLAPEQRGTEPSGPEQPDPSAGPRSRIPADAPRHHEDPPPDPWDDPAPPDDRFEPMHDARSNKNARPNNNARPNDTTPAAPVTPSADRATVGRSVAEARQRIRPTRHARGAQPSEPEDDFDESEADDAVVIDDSSTESQADLLKEYLGAELIGEEGDNKPTF